MSSASAAAPPDDGSIYPHKDVPSEKFTVEAHSYAIQGEFPCKEFTCKIQTCLAQNDYQQRRCAAPIQDLVRCCQKVGEPSLHCMGFNIDYPPKPVTPEVVTAVVETAPKVIAAVEAIAPQVAEVVEHAQVVFAEMADVFVPMVVRVTEVFEAPAEVEEVAASPAGVEPPADAPTSEAAAQ